MDRGKGSGFLVVNEVRLLKGSNEPDGPGSSSSDESGMGRLGDHARLSFVTEMDESPTGGGISISISSPDEESESELTVTTLCGSPG